MKAFNAPLQGPAWKARQGAVSAPGGALAGGTGKSAYRGCRASGRGCLAWGSNSPSGRGGAGRFPGVRPGRLAGAVAL